MSTMKHEVTQIAPRTWCISEFRLVNAFLVEGDERAALIDTCCGIGNLAGVVRELTDKPLTVIITHGHFDHDGGMYQFPGVETYLNPLDGQNIEMTLKRMKEMFGSDDMNQMRKFYTTSRLPVRWPEANVEDVLAMIPTEPTNDRYEWKPMTDGTEIDLGGRVLKIIQTPGHTPGEVCVLDEQSRILFGGDTSNQSIILMRQPDNGTVLIEEANRTMAKIWTYADKFDKIGVGHDTITLDKQIVKDYLDLTTGLLNGTITGAYEETGFRKGDVARLGLAELWYQCDA